MECHEFHLPKLKTYDFHFPRLMLKEATRAAAAVHEFHFLSWSKLKNFVV